MRTFSIPERIVLVETRHQQKALVSTTTFSIPERIVLVETHNRYCNKQCG